MPRASRGRRAGEFPDNGSREMETDRRSSDRHRCPAGSETAYSRPSGRRPWHGNADLQVGTAARPRGRAAKRTLRTDERLVAIQRTMDAFNRLAGG